MLNFQLEAHQRLFLDIAKYTGYYLEEEQAQKQVAEEQAKEHFLELSDSAWHLVQEYQEFISKFKGGDYDTVNEHFELMRASLKETFTRVGGADKLEMAEEVDLPEVAPEVPTDLPADEEEAGLRKAAEEGEVPPPAIVEAAEEDADSEEAPKPKPAPKKVEEGADDEEEPKPKPVESKAPKEQGEAAQGKPFFHF